MSKKKKLPTKETLIPPFETPSVDKLISNQSIKNKKEKEKEYKPPHLHVSFDEYGNPILDI